MRSILTFILVFGQLSLVFSQEWEIASQNPAMQISEISFADPEFGMAIGRGNNLVPTVFKTEDGGYTWTPSLVVDSVNFYSWTALKVASRTNALAAPYVNGRIYKYDGTTWHLIQTGTTDHINDFYMCDQDTGYAAGEYGLLLKTTNGGETWNLLPRITDNDIQEIDGSGPVHLKAIASVAWPKGPSGKSKTDPWFGYIYTSHWSGLSWYDQEFTNYQFYGLSTVDDTISFICGDHYPSGGFNNSPFIWKIDKYFNNMSWYYYNHSRFLDIDFANLDHGVLVGEDGFISRYYSNNWHDEISPTTLDLHSVCIIMDTVTTSGGSILHLDAWASGDSGTVLKFSETIVGDAKSYNDSETTFIYPNPFGNQVKLNLPEGITHAILTISDVGGKSLKEIEVRNRSGIVLDLSFLNPGIYLACLKTPGHTFNQRILKYR